MKVKKEEHVVLLGVNSSRQVVFLDNRGEKTAWISFGSPMPAGKCLALDPNERVKLEGRWLGNKIQAITESGTTDVVAYSPA